MLTSHTAHRMTAIMGELQPCGLSRPEQPLRLDPDAALATYGGPAAALLIGPEPRQRLRKIMKMPRPVFRSGFGRRRPVTAFRSLVRATS